MVTEHALNNVSHKSMWIWMPIGLLLALGIHIRLTDIGLLADFNFDLGLFLPVWTAFMTYHFGRRALYPLLIVLVPVLVTIDLKGIGDSSNVFWLSHSVDHALIAVFTAFVFWRSAPWEWMNANLAKHGRWSVFLAFVVLWIVHAAWPFTYGRGFVSELLRWDLGTAAAAIIGATALRHAPLVSYFQRVSPRLGVFLYAFAFSFMVLCILVLPIRFAYDTFSVDYRSGAIIHDQWTVKFGALKDWSCLYVLSFVLVAAGAFDLRHLLGLMVLTGVIQFMGLMGMALTGVIESMGLRGLMDFSSRLTYALSDIVYFGSPALLGAVTAPYWSTLDATKLTTRHTTILLGVVLALEFVAKPFTYIDSYNSYNELVLCGLAFVSALIWGGRATIAVPIALQLGFLLSYVLSGSGSFGDLFDRDTQRALTSCVRLGMIAFPFAFFGLLARRAE